MNAAKLIGKNVVLDQQTAPLSPCKYCGCCEGNIRPGVGPHKAQVRCNGCDRGLGWLSHHWLQYFLMQQSVAQGGSNASAA